MKSEKTTPNMGFVTAFDGFLTCGQAAEHVEKLVVGKHYKVPDFPVDLAAILARAKLFRKALSS